MNLYHIELHLNGKSNWLYGKEFIVLKHAFAKCCVAVFESSAGLTFSGFVPGRRSVRSALQQRQKTVI